MRCRQESRENFPEEDDRRAISDHIIFPSRQSAANLHDMPQSAGIVPWQFIQLADVGQAGHERRATYRQGP